MFGKMFPEQKPKNIEVTKNNIPIFLEYIIIFIY